MRPLVVAFVAAGCCGPPTYSDYEVNVGTVLDAAPLVEPLPVTMAVYYSPEFRNFKTVDTTEEDAARANEWNYCGLPALRFHLALREPSAALFDRVFSAMFERAVLIPARPPLIGVGAGLDGIIEPRIKRIWVLEHREKLSDPRRVISETSIEYGFMLYSSSGEVLASWSVSGAIEARGWEIRYQQLFLANIAHDTWEKGQ